MDTATNKISFADDVKAPIINHPDSDERQRKMSIGSQDGERLRRLSTSSSTIPEGVVLDPQERQDWNKTTADRDTWAHQERRRLSGWSNTNVATFKHQEGRRGSVFSMWAPGKDKDGNDILMHDDHMDRADARSESGRSDGGAAVLGNGNTLMPSSPKENALRRASNNSDRPDRRGSVLSMWKGGKDAKGNDIVGHDDEEWAR